MASLSYVYFVLLSCELFFSLSNSYIVKRNTESEYGLRQPNLSFSCPNSKSVLVEGNVVKFSDIELHFSTAFDQNSVCWDRKQLKELTIFANNTVEVDKTFSASRELCFDDECYPFYASESGFHMTVLAPTWNISGEKQIDVSGGQGSSWGPKSTISLDGFPGTPGGTFIGIGEKFNGGEHLTIVANGGDGTDAIAFSGKGGRGGAMGKISVIGLREKSGIVMQKSVGYPGKDGNENQGGNETLDKDFEPTFMTLNKYKSFLRKNLKGSQKTEKRAIKNFIRVLENNNNTQQMYDITGLIEDLERLEEEYSSFGKYEDFLPFYQSLMDRIRAYADLKEGFIDPKNKKVLSFLYTAALGRYYTTLKDLSDSYLVIDVKEYLVSNKVNFEYIYQRIKKMKEEEEKLQEVIDKLEKVNKHREEYKKEIDMKIKEAQDIIEKVVNTEIDKINKKINENIDKLIDEIHELQKNAKENKEKLVEKQNQLKKLVVLQKMFGFFKVLGSLGGVFGPVGAAIGAAVTKGSSIAESLVIGDKLDQPVPEVPQLPASIQSVEYSLKNISDRSQFELDTVLRIAIEEAKESPQVLGDLEKKSHDWKDLLKVDPEKAEQLKTAFKGWIEKKIGKVQTKYPPDSEKAKKATASLQKLNALADAGGEIINMYKQHKKSQAKLDSYSAAIQQATENINKLQKYEDAIYNVLTPTLKNMQSGLKETAKKLANKSLVSLEVTKWQVQASLREIQEQVRKMTEGFQVQESFSKSITKLLDAMTLMINLFDHIQVYQEHQRFADYLADIVSPNAVKIKVDDSHTNFTKNVKKMLQYNVVVQQFTTAVNAFKQHVFPFGYKFLREMTLPFRPQNNGTLDEFLPKAVKDLALLNYKFLSHKQQIQKHDEYIGTAVFNSDYVSRKPFYVWRNANYNDTISNLFSNEEITLKADIMRNENEEDAIKFNEFEFHFKARNESDQYELNEILKHFKIFATHLGNSYYRFNEKYYLIQSKSIPFELCFEKDMSTGQPVCESQSYSKIKSGDYMLSPYALWKLHLIKSSAFASFEKLTAFKDNVDLELIGKGHFVSRNYVKFNDIMEDEYYRPIKMKHTGSSEENELDGSSEELDSVDFYQDFTLWSKSESSSLFNRVDDFDKTGVIRRSVAL